jgi:hypothetical protein
VRQEALKIEVERARTEVKFRNAERERQEFIENAQLMDDRLHEYEMRATIEGASGTTQIHAGYLFYLVSPLFQIRKQSVYESLEFLCRHDWCGLLHDDVITRNGLRGNQTPPYSIVTFACTIKALRS